MRALRPYLVGTTVAALISLMGGCKPDYPKCETDKDCAEKKEFCVSGKCQQCRSAADCPEGSTCNAGRCDKIPGYCQNRSQCPEGQECIANRCGPCKGDADCPGGTKCWKGMCDNKKHCSKEDDCAQDEDCTGGVCTPARKPPPARVEECSLAPVFFDFNESALTTDATSVLARDADCIKKTGRALTAVGHADPRGTAEYNIALSERRAQSVKGHLERLGIDSAKMAVLPRGSLDAKGTDEPSWAQDRRVDFNWR